MLDIPIVIAAYNRHESLKRLLGSLSKAVYPEDVTLIISVDGGEGNEEVIKLAEKFKWIHGEKLVIASDYNLGLRNHILKCGRLSMEYDGIILLEDDLYVSPYFYSYVLQSHAVYSATDEVSGIALYSHQYNETACLPFKPMDDGYDVFFMQIPCSWGQSWLSHQWKAFEKWYDLNKDLDLSSDTEIPPDVRLWPETSWKKYYLKYMLQNKLFFVYPRISLVTNFADPGVHHTGSNIFQVPFLYSNKTYSFPKINASFSKYDSYCEVFPETLAKYNKMLSGYDFEVDLYGMKNKNDILAKYTITIQKLRDSKISFSRRLKPHEMNICENIVGNEIFFGLTANMAAYDNFLVYRNTLNQDYQNTHGYHYLITKWHYRTAVSQKQALFYDSISRRIKQIFS